MAVLKIRTLGDPILRTKAAPIRDFDPELASLASDMHETMDAAPGVGLAAPQVGRLMRMFVFNDREGDDPRRGSLCNPEIVWHSDETEEAEEGCLSIPGTYFPVVRWTGVRIRAREVTGDEGEHEAEGFLARIFQHEIDHLDGVLFIDRLAPDLRKEAKRLLLDQDFGMAPPPRPRKAL